jgi:Ni/Co efflux regulator RcnB
MKKLLTAAAAFSVLVSAGAASAQSYGSRNDDRDNGRYDQRHDGRQDRYEDHRDRYDNRGERRAERRYNAGRYHAPKGYYARHWRQGDRLPASYRGRAYVVDYHRYGLRAPPRGYQYTRVDNDVMLTAVATGLIASVIVGMFQ